MQRNGLELAELIGVSDAIAAVRDMIDRVAGSSATVLVTGPSGSGKEVVAQLLHQRGARAARPFVAVNCGALPAELIESEIFGHEAGAFTGAVKARRGRFELADTGTLFLDEVGDMPLAMQVKLLRVLETRVVERVGGMIGTPVDVRVVAATNVDLGAAVAAGNFREDLFYRLAVVEIAMPALAERRDDIVPLIEHFVARGVPARRVEFSVPALDALRELPWRGNIRELRNLVDRASALHPGETVDRATALQLADSVVRGLAPVAVRRPLPRVVEPDDAFVDLKQVLDAIEQGYIERTLLSTAGGVAETARRLGLRRTTLIEKMRRLNISRLPAC
ncbi:sigma-54 dependent transcriptional regulator [Sphingosinicellaceae bacterium]|nr:sigma-54 dependent transcriptional regulator [Sphingosinicellaceae bacterium]